MRLPNLLNEEVCSSDYSFCTSPSSSTTDYFVVSEQSNNNRSTSASSGYISGSDYHTNIDLKANEVLDEERESLVDEKEKDDQALKQLLRADTSGMLATLTKPTDLSQNSRNILVSTSPYTLVATTPTPVPTTNTTSETTTPTTTSSSTRDNSSGRSSRRNRKESQKKLDARKRLQEHKQRWLRQIRQSGGETCSNSTYNNSNGRDHHSTTKPTSPTFTFPTSPSSTSTHSKYCRRITAEAMKLIRPYKSTNSNAKETKIQVQVQEKNLK